MASGTSGVEELPANDMDILCASGEVSNARASVSDQWTRAVEATVRRELIEFHETRLISARRKLHAKGVDVSYELRERVRRHERFLDYLKGGE